jgi:hypothetical protein
MNKTQLPDITRTVPVGAAPLAMQTSGAHRFCPSMFCFTDEVIVHRVTARAGVWLLTEADDGHSWLMIGDQPTCPHCGTLLL